LVGEERKRRKRESDRDTREEDDRKIERKRTMSLAMNLVLMSSLERRLSPSTILRMMASELFHMLGGKSRKGLLGSA